MYQHSRDQFKKCVDKCKAQASQDSEESSPKKHELTDCAVKCVN